EHELGRGAFARVFLERQMGLAGRPVVLKISSIVGNEPQTLAQLQHTHIVPIWSLHEDARAGLRAVCMPYFGGATLGEVLHAAWQTEATLGGTVAYMAPEHLRALIARDPALARQVDQRSDVYSLGMVLYEMLAGRGPFEQKASYSPLRELVEAMAEERAHTTP